MKNADKIMQARAFMGQPCEGEHECVSCGLSCRASQKISKCLKGTFTNFDEMSIGTGVYLCDSCKALMEDRDMRFKPVFFERIGEKKIPERADILELIKNPPKQFVLSVPYSCKKHHWLFAGLSSDKVAFIGTDNRTVVFDYESQDVPGAVNTIHEMIQGGVPRNEIIAGRYSTFTRFKVPNIEDYESKIKDMRPGGEVELIVKYTPAINEKIELGGDIVITKSEQMAAELLLEVALRSQIRANDGIRFWGGFFERRINRFKNLPMHEFVSRLCDSVGSPTIATYAVSELSTEDEEEVMENIRSKTNLMVSMTYTLNKEAKGK